MIAEVIPLRRRAHDAAWTPREAEPSHSGVFDPPPDPEPPEEYSVWERPTAELVRRERPEDRVPSVAQRRGWESVRSWPVGVIAVALIVAAVLIVAPGNSHRSPQGSATTELGSAHLGLGAALGGGQPGTRPLRTGHATRP